MPGWPEARGGASATAEGKVPKTRLGDGACKNLGPRRRSTRFFEGGWYPEMGYNRP